MVGGGEVGGSEKHVPVGEDGAVVAGFAAGGGDGVVAAVEARRDEEAFAERAEA